MVLNSYFFVILSYEESITSHVLICRIRICPVLCILKVPLFMSRTQGAVSPPTPPLETTGAGSNHHKQGKYASPPPPPLAVPQSRYIYTLWAKPYPKTVGSAISIDVNSPYAAECWTSSEFSLCLWQGVSTGDTFELWCALYSIQIISVPLLSRMKRITVSFTTPKPQHNTLPPSQRGQCI
jgi:hypothetical protein